MEAAPLLAEAAVEVAAPLKLHSYQRALHYFRRKHLFDALLYLQNSAASAAFLLGFGRPRRLRGEAPPVPDVVRKFWRHQKTSGLAGIWPWIDRICIGLF